MKWYENLFMRINRSLLKFWFYVSYTLIPALRQSRKKYCVSVYIRSVYDILISLYQWLFNRIYDVCRARKSVISRWSLWRLSMILLSFFFEQSHNSFMFLMTFRSRHHEKVTIPITNTNFLKTTHNHLICDLLRPFYDSLNRQKFITKLFCFQQLETFNKTIFFHRFSWDIFLQTLQYRHRDTHWCEITFYHYKSEELFYVWKRERIDEKC